MGLKKGICLGLATASVLGFCSVIFGISTDISAKKCKKEALELARETAVYQTLYETDTAEQQEKLDQATIDFAFATEKYKSGEITRAEYTLAKQSYDLAVQEFEYDTKYYSSDEYLESIIQDAMPKSEESVKKYEEAKKLETISAATLIGGATACALGISARVWVGAVENLML